MHPTQNPATGIPDAGLPTTGIELTPADTLRGAALYLERYGWTQGDYFDRIAAAVIEPFPPACAHGAIAVAVYGEATYTPHSLQYAAVDRRGFARASEFFDDYVIRHHGAPDDEDRRLEGIAWNDQTGRSAAEVITALRAAAQEWDDTHGGAR